MILKLQLKQLLELNLPQNLSILKKKIKELKYKFGILPGKKNSEPSQKLIIVVP
jgi:hypothetical protein